MAESIERNYEIVGLTREGTLVIRFGDGEPKDSGVAAKAWVGGREALRPGGTFDYFTDAEKMILRRGLRDY